MPAMKVWMPCTVRKAQRDTERLVELGEHGFVMPRDDVEGKLGGDGRVKVDLVYDDDNPPDARVAPGKGDWWALVEPGKAPVRLSRQNGVLRPVTGRQAPKDVGCRHDHQA